MQKRLPHEIVLAKHLTWFYFFHLHFPKRPRTQCPKFLNVWWYEPLKRIAFASWEYFQVTNSELCFKKSALFKADFSTALKKEYYLYRFEIK